MIPDMSMIIVLPNHIHVWMNMITPRRITLVLSPSPMNWIGESMRWSLESAWFTGPTGSDSPQSWRNSTATDAAVMMLGRYITTLKNPFPGILSLASVNQTASDRERMIWGMKLPTQRITVFLKHWINSFEIFFWLLPPLPVRSTLKLSSPTNFS